MPTQNVWDNLLFDLASSLTGGLVTDLKTALLAAVFLGFLAMGFDMLFELLHSMSATSAFDSARKYFNLMRSDENLHGKDSPEYDYHSRVYGVHMNNAVNQSFAAGKPAYEPDIISTGDDIASNSDGTYGIETSQNVGFGDMGIDSTGLFGGSEAIPDPSWEDSHRVFDDED